ncbi:MAG: hypothetical protein PVF17_07790 [Ignavibacteria bacterium]
MLGGGLKTTPLGIIGESIMREEMEILLELFKDQMIHARHHEQLRATVSNIMITISGVIIGFIVFDESINKSDTAAILFLIILGIFGTFISMKHYQHLRRHQNRAEKYRDNIEKLFPNLEIKKWLSEALEQNQSDFPILSKLRLHTFWSVLHILIVLIGIYLFVILYC